MNYNFKKKEQFDSLILKMVLPKKEKKWAFLSYIYLMNDT